MNVYGCSWKILQNCKNNSFQKDENKNCFTLPKKNRKRESPQAETIRNYIEFDVFTHQSELKSGQKLLLSDSPHVPEDPFSLSIQN